MVGNVAQMVAGLAGEELVRRSANPGDAGSSSASLRGPAPRNWSLLLAQRAAEVDVMPVEALETGPYDVVDTIRAGGGRTGEKLPGVPSSILRRAVEDDPCRFACGGGQGSAAA